MEETEYAFLRSRELRVVLNDDKGIIGFPRISVDIAVEKPLRYEDQAEIELQLCEADGKHIVYEFQIEHGEELAATGTFKVACCRFPTGENPYAILTPEFVLEKLIDENVSTP